MNSNIRNVPEHHSQQNLCETRAPYRQGKKLTAVKVYTINNESSHLYVYGVPKIKLRSELKSLFMKYGHIINIHVVQNVETELFTECYHISYERIQSARIAKKLEDNKNYYGGILHVCYAPECETLEETKRKLLQRNKDVLARLGNSNGSNNRKEVEFRQNVDRKRKHPALELNAARLANLDPDVVWNNVPAELDPRQPQKKYQTFAAPNKYFQMPQKEYGPNLPDGILPNKTESAPVLVPTPVIKANKKEVIKRIVFKNKKVNED